MTCGRDHAFQVEVADRVSAEIVPDLVERALIGEQFVRIGEVDSVIAGELVRRTANAHVDLFRAGLSQGNYS